VQICFGKQTFALSTFISNYAFGLVYLQKLDNNGR